MGQDTQEGFDTHLHFFSNNDAYQSDIWQRHWPHFSLTVVLYPSFLFFTSLLLLFQTKTTSHQLHQININIFTGKKKSVLSGAPSWASCRKARTHGRVLLAWLLSVEQRRHWRQPRSCQVGSAKSSYCWFRRTFRERYLWNIWKWPRRVLFLSTLSFTIQLPFLCIRLEQRHFDRSV